MKVLSHTHDTTPMTVTASRWGTGLLVSAATDDGEWIAQVAVIDDSVQVRPQERADWPLAVLAGICELLEGELGGYLRAAQPSHVRLVDGGA